MVHVCCYEKERVKDWCSRIADSESKRTTNRTMHGLFEVFYTYTSSLACNGWYLRYWRRRDFDIKDYDDRKNTNSCCHPTPHCHTATEKLCIESSSEKCIFSLREKNSLRF